MTRKWMRTLAACQLLLVVSPASRTLHPMAAELATAPRDIDARVDLSRRLGRVPAVLHPGLWVSVDHKPGQFVRWMVGRDFSLSAVGVNIERVLMASSGLEDFSQRLEQDGEFTEWARAAKAQGARFVVTIVKTPRWLASKSSDRVDPLSGFAEFSVSPPRDYGLWERLVESVVTHFSRRLGVSAAYAIWNEPEIYSWGGTDREYLELYRRAAQAVKRVDPSALVGGPAVSELLAEKQPPEKATRRGPFLQQFLLGAGQMRLPLDFVVWHEFNSLPQSYGWKVETVREWLGAAGYPATTPLWVLDWNGWQHFDTKNPVYRWGSEDRDTEVNASFAVASVGGMRTAGIGLQTFGTLEEMDQEMFNSPSQFVGGFGALTRNYVVKPVYHAFGMLGRLEGELVAVETSDPLLTVLAASTGGTHTLLLSNFIPTDQMLKEDGDRVLKLVGVSGPFLRQHGLSRELVQGIVSGTTPVDDPRVPTQVRPRLARLRDLLTPNLQIAQAAPARRTTPARIKVRWEGLAAGTWRLERFLIDSQHSNSFARRQEVEERLRRLRSDVRAEVVQQLRQEGATEAQVRELERLTEQGARPPTLSGELRRWRDRAFELGRQIGVQRLDALNRMPGVGLELVETRTVKGEGPEAPFEMLPNSVTLLVLQR